MGKLIDTDELLELASKVTVSGGRYGDRVAVAGAIGKAIHLLIDAVPTAFDTDKVVEQLEAEARFYNSASDIDQAIRTGILIAIEIVKAGGKK